MRGLKFFSNPHTGTFLREYRLSKGAHPNRYPAISRVRKGDLDADEAVATINSQMCAMEMVAYLNGEPLTDYPSCSDRNMAVAVQTWNDSIEDDGRRNELLRPIIPEVVGTGGALYEDKKAAWNYAIHALNRIASLLRAVPRSEPDPAPIHWGAAGIASLLWSIPDDYPGKRSVRSHIARAVRGIDWDFCPSGTYEQVQDEAQKHLINICKILKGECVEKEEDDV
jgi:hypothetical protein